MQPALDESPPPDWFCLKLQADPASVRDGLARMLALPPLADLTAEDRGLAELVLAEVLNNVGEHAYAGGSGPVTVSLWVGVDGIGCMILDHGSEMPGRRLPEGKLPGGPETALEDLPEGGFGWHLIRTMTKDLTYKRNAGRNELAFTIPKGR